MSTVGDLVTSISTRTSSVLGANYSQASYGIELLKNQQKGSQKVYSVLPMNITNVSTVTRSVTYDQEFMVKIANTYINSNMNDSIQRQTAIDLIEGAKDLYKDLVDTKCGSPSICLNTSDLQVDSPIHLPESKLVVIEMTFIVKYRELI